jgi:hypothetical protein
MPISTRWATSVVMGTSGVGAKRIIAGALVLLASTAAKTRAFPTIID